MGVCSDSLELCGGEDDVPISITASWRDFPGVAPAPECLPCYANLLSHVGSGEVCHSVNLNRHVTSCLYCCILLHTSSSVSLRCIIASSLLVSNKIPNKIWKFITSRNMVEREKRRLTTLAA
jgi:hypothetical protein